MIPGGRRPPCALTIAGSDPTGGAGIQADLATFLGLGVHGASVITAITAQTAAAVLAVEPLTPRSVGRQLEAVLSDLRPGAVKTGMLGTGGVVTAVAARLRRTRVGNLVVDPVIRSSSGAPLLDRDGVKRLRISLLPIARVVTPNLEEAEALSGLAVQSLADAEAAARAILRLGPEVVVVTGGHLAGFPHDLFVDARRTVRLEGRRIRGGGAHGTGCVFSAAVAAHLALGLEPLEAVVRAKRWVAAALRDAWKTPSGGRLMRFGRR
jgi:hydroxymethylpyrimidine/phosphomethylpyrimidine kinase